MSSSQENFDEDYKICDHCKIESSELFHCQTCDNNGDQFELGVEYLCHTCIVHHLVIHHTIVDRKGEKPLVCRGHKMLQHEYCRTCDVTFCWRCMSIHSGHTFEPLEERASELKGKVIEMLTELELDEKPLRVKKSSISNAIEKHKNEQRLIREQIDEEIDKLRTACYKAIEDNCKLMYDDLENISQFVDETVVLQKKLRHLLSSSSAHMIKNFPETDNDVILNKINGNKLINLDESTLICKITSLSNKFKQCVKLLTDQVKSEMLKSCETEKEISEKKFVTAFCVEIGDYAFTVSTEGNCLSSHEVMGFHWETCAYLELIDSVEFNETITQYHSLNHEYNIHLLLLTGNKMVYATRIDTRINLKEHPYPNFDHILLPFSFPSSCPNPHIDWSYWDEESELIRFTHIDTFTIKCDTLPRVTNTHQRNDNIFCFISKQNNLIVADVCYGKYWIIQFELTAFVSCVFARRVKTDHLIVVIWCGESVFSCEKKSSYQKFSNPEKQDTPSTITLISIEGVKYRLLTKITTPSGKDYEASLVLRY